MSIIPENITTVNHFTQAQHYADRVVALLKMPDVDDDLLKDHLHDFVDIYANGLDEKQRSAIVEHVKTSLNGDLSDEARAKAEFLFFGTMSPENVPDPAETLAEAFGMLTQGATWSDMQELIGPVSWAWERWLPNGVLTIIAGEPGLGKSILCLRMAACYLTGDKWPDETTNTNDTGAVLWCEAEAAQALNLERARTWGLPLDRLYTPLSNPLDDVQLDLSEHQEAVTELAHRPEVKLIVVDSLRGVHRGDENSSVTMEVVKWLAELARDSGKPILLTHHLRKRSVMDIGDRITLDRVRGSSAIIQTARMIWAIDTPDLGNTNHKRLSVIKSNLARFPEAIGFSIGDDLSLHFGDAPEAPKQETQLDKACDLLLALLDKEPIKSSDLEEEANGAGISWRTMCRAKKKLGVIDKRKTINGTNGKSRIAYFWALPTNEDIPF